ncbi:hypothetical protein LTR50_002082 [Elasticomyces elasticus]|nr:hypothetical protein LTR50_002082 [Elasticomyces elasticus]
MGRGLLISHVAILLVFFGQERHPRPVLDLDLHLRKRAASTAAAGEAVGAEVPLDAIAGPQTLSLQPDRQPVEADAGCGVEKTAGAVEEGVFGQVGGVAAGLVSVDPVGGLAEEETRAAGGGQASVAVAAVADVVAP